MVIFIIGISSAITLPSMQNWWQRQQSENLKNTVLNQLQIAKQYAEIQSVNVCFSSKNSECADSPIESIHSQLLVWRKQQARPKKIIFKTTLKLYGRLYFNIFPRYRNFLIFKSLSALATDNGSIWYCPVGAVQSAWVIKISKSGDIRVADTTQAALAGKPLRCR